MSSRAFRILLTPPLGLYMAAHMAARYAWQLLYVVATGALWARPRHLTPEELERAPADVPYQVFAFSHVAWGHIWQRNHHTMSQLARHRRVVYFEHSPFSYLHTAPRAVIEWLRTGHPKPAIFARDAAGVRLRQLLLLPAESRSRLVAWLNARLLALEVRYEWARGGRGPYVLWFYFPAGVRVLDLTDPAGVVYDIQDQYTAFSWAPRDIGAREERLLRAAQVVFPGTHALHESREHPNKHFFACGVEFDHFQQAAPPDARKRLPEPEPLRRAGAAEARLFYAGLIDARIDRELLRRLGEAHPEWQVVMVGPVDEKLFDRRRLPANVLFPGRRPYPELPQWIAWSDLLIMPWAQNELTSYINPTKTLEYLAARKPIVSTAIPDLRKFYSELCLLADSPEEFVALCERALASPDEERLDRGVERARANSWESVVGAMEGHIRDALRAK